MKPISPRIRAMVVATILADPTRPYHEIANEYGISSWSVCKFTSELLVICEVVVIGRKEPNCQY